MRGGHLIRGGCGTGEGECFKKKKSKDSSPQNPSSLA